MIKKLLKNKCIKFLSINLLILLLNCNYTYKAFSLEIDTNVTVGTQDQIDEMRKTFKIDAQSSETVSDKVLKDLFAESGYRVASQAEIDAIRAKALVQTPEIVSKYPIAFGMVPDSYNLDDYPETKAELEEQHRVWVEEHNGAENIVQYIGQDLLKWVNDTVDKTPDGIETVQGDPVSSVTTGQKMNIYPNTKLTVTDNKGNVFTFDNPNYRYYDIKITQKSGFDSYYQKPYYITRADLEFFGTDGVFIDSPVASETYSDTGFSTPTISVIDDLGHTEFPTVIEIDHTGSKTNFLPYPTTEEEITENTKVPIEIKVPIKTNEDGTVTPIAPTVPPVFPTTITPPDTTGLSDMGDSVVVWDLPNVNPDTGTVIDPDFKPKPVPNPDTIPTPDPNGEPTIDLNVPKNDVPTLNFKPLEVAIRKFPFCIPWDFWDTYKVFEGNAEPFKYEFKEVSVNFSFIDCGSVTVLPNFTIDFSDYPQLDTAIHVLKYLELLAFISMLVIKTRNLIRG